MLIRDFKLNTKLSKATKRYISKIKLEKHSVFIGIRLGDYTNKELKKYGNLNSSYFKAAVSIIMKKIKNPKFYIFSNDIDLVKKINLFNDINHIYIDDINNAQEELEIMRSCSNAIIMNSTFHWWGAYLIENKNKIVISPKKWFKNGWRDNIIPKNWIRI